MGVKLNYRNLKTGNQSARLIIYREGKRIIENLDIIIYPNDPDRRKKRAMCEQIRTKREYELMMNTYKIPTESNTPMFRDAVMKVINSNTIARVRIYKSMLEYVLEVIGDKRIDQINPHDAQDLADYLTSKMSTHGAQTFFKAFKRILNDAVRLGVIPASPASNVPMKKPQNKRIKEILSIGEFRALLEHTPEKVHPVLILAYYTGMGLTEILRFSRDNVVDGMIQYSRAKSDVFVQVPAKPWLIDILESIDYSFDHVAKSWTYYDTGLKKWCAAAGIRKRISFYCFRHSFAVNVLIASDGDIEILRRYMGHTSYTHTMKYLEYYHSVRGSVIDRLPDL